MPQYKFVYLDDKDLPSIEPLAEALERELEGERESLKVKPENPRPEFGQQLKALSEERIDGLILDLRLDETPGTFGQANYRGLALAQEIRTRATEDKAYAFPLLLVSSQLNLTKSFSSDRTGHDVVDRYYIKEKVADDSEQMAREMVALVKGYSSIRRIADTDFHWDRLLGITAKTTDYLHSRMFEEFESLAVRPPAHEISQFILKQLIDTSGPLIDDATALARLGIAPDSPATDILLDRLTTFCGYNGFFSSATKRWWAKGIERFWLQKSKSKVPLRAVKAEDRVQILKKALRLPELLASPPIDKGYSTNYWTICRGYKRPLDPIDGVLMASAEPKPWQEPSYLSRKAAKLRVGRELGLKPKEIEVFRTTSG